jgi:hypothetical protein
MAIDMLRARRARFERQGAARGSAAANDAGWTDFQATEQMLANPPGSDACYAAHHRVLAIRALQADLIRLVDDPKILRAAAERRRRFAQ